ncbi:MAG: hypothetical protein ACYCT1_08315 [Steroidobacteraceae bacterium]
MKHAREDYQRIQDPAKLIPEDEPVFLLRGQDAAALAAVEEWVNEAGRLGASPAMIGSAQAQADRMRQWQREHGGHVPDMPDFRVEAVIREVLRPYPFVLKDKAKVTELVERMRELFPSDPRPSIREVALQDFAQKVRHLSEGYAETFDPKMACAAMDDLRHTLLPKLDRDV